MHDLPEWFTDKENSSIVSNNSFLSKKRKSNQINYQGNDEIMIKKMIEIFSINNNSLLDDEEKDEEKFINFKEVAAIRSNVEKKIKKNIFKTFVKNENIFKVKKPNVKRESTIKKENSKISGFFTQLLKDNVKSNLEKEIIEKNDHYFSVSGFNQIGTISKLKPLLHKNVKELIDPEKLNSIREIISKNESIKNLLNTKMYLLVKQYYDRYYDDPSLMEKLKKDKKFCERNTEFSKQKNFHTSIVNLDFENNNKKEYGYLAYNEIIF